MEKMDYILILLTIALSISCYNFGYNMGSQRLSLGSSIGIKPTASPISVCQNKSFDSAIQCLNNNFTSWYHYNISTIDLPYNDTQLKVNGGVCWSASQWYVGQAISLGFNGTTASIWGKADNKINGHTIAILNSLDMKDYCVVDQSRIVGCGSLST